MVAAESEVSEALGEWTYRMLAVLTLAPPAWLVASNLGKEAEPFATLIFALEPVVEHWIQILGRQTPVQGVLHAMRGNEDDAELNSSRRDRKPAEPPRTCPAWTLLVGISLVLAVTLGILSVIAVTSWHPIGAPVVAVTALGRIVVCVLAGRYAALHARSNPYGIAIGSVFVAQTLINLILLPVSIASGEGGVQISAETVGTYLAAVVLAFVAWYSCRRTLALQASPPTPAHRETVLDQKTAPPKASPRPTPGLTCPRCGSSNAAPSRFCSQCGTQIPRLRPFYCGECGARLAEGARFCNQCGTAVEGVSDQPVPVRPDTSNAVQPGT